MRRDHVLQFVLEAAQTPDFQGVTAQAVADALSIWRNDAAVELNKLVAEGKLRRVGKKNVRFFPASEETADIRPEPAVQEEPPQAEEETGQYRAFSGLVGADGSLKYQLRVAMAADVCTGRLYIRDVDGSKIEKFAQAYGSAENLTELVFLVNSKDTRFDERAVLRPLLNS